MNQDPYYEEEKESKEIGNQQSGRINSPKVNKVNFVNLRNLSRRETSNFNYLPQDNTGTKATFVNLSYKKPLTTRNLETIPSGLKTTESGNKQIGISPDTHNFVVVIFFIINCYDFEGGLNIWLYRRHTRF